MINYVGNSLNANETVKLKTADGEKFLTKDKIKTIKDMIIVGSKSLKIIKLMRIIQINAKRNDLNNLLERTTDTTKRNTIIEKLNKNSFAKMRHKDHLYKIKNLFYWMKDHFHYENDPLGMEVINDAEAQAKHFEEGWLTGDCDEFAVAAGALLRAVGIPVRLVLWKRPGGEWQHIFIKAFAANKNKWYVVDATEKNKPFNYRASFGTFKEIKFEDDNLPAHKLGAYQLSEIYYLSQYKLDGFFSNVGKWVKKQAKNVGKYAKKAWNVAKKAAAPLISNAIGMIPGVPPVVANMAGKMVNKLINSGKPNKAMNQMNERLAKGEDPNKLMKLLVNNSAMKMFKDPILDNVKSFIPQLQKLNWQRPQQAIQQAAQLTMQRMPTMAAQAFTRNPWMQQQYPYLPYQPAVPWYNQQMVQNQLQSPIYRPYQKQEQPTNYNPYQMQQRPTNYNPYQMQQRRQMIASMDSVFNQSSEDAADYILIGCDVN